nr:MAG TPA: hypothetical protein [Caudoviricetes sp.]
MSCFQFINCFFHLSLSPQADRYGVGTIFRAILAHVRNICKPIGFNVCVFPGHFPVVGECHFCKVVRSKCIRNRFNGFEVLGFDLDVSKACPIGNFELCFVFKDNFVHNFLFLSIKMVYKLRSNICSIYFLKRQFKNIRNENTFYR